MDKSGNVVSSLVTVCPLSSSSEFKHSTVADDNANPLEDTVSLNNNNNRQQLSVLDFVSIFAENNLVDDHCVLNRPEHLQGKDKWNLTLPEAFERKYSPTERPRTLTPLCTSNSGKKRFRKHDWKFYVHGRYKTLIPVQKKHEYGFSPIKDDDTNYNNVSEEVPNTRHRTEVSVLDKGNTGTKSVNLNSAFANGKKEETQTSVLEVKLTENSFKPCRNVSSSSSISNSNSKQRSEPFAETSTSVSTNGGADNANFQENDGAHVLSNKDRLHIKQVSKIDNSITASMNLQELDCRFTKDAFFPVHDNNVSANNNATQISPELVKVKSPILKRPIVPVICVSHNVRHEGTMAQISTESSTSDAYYRESSLSPSSPDIRGRPTFEVPPPPALDKHEARLKLSSKNSRSKSNERKNKKRSKSKDGKLKRDASPSKTERSHEGKVSIATQTQKSIKGYKGANKAFDNRLDNKNIEHNSKINKSGDSFENSEPYNVAVLPMPVSKRVAMESSTSSDESGDYKKVNITALRERFIQNREKTKHTQPKIKDSNEKKTIDSKNHSQSKETSSCSTSSQINEAISRDNPLQADSDKFTPVDKMGTFDNDILENDMYNFEDSRDTTPVNYIEDQCALQECDYCNVMQLGQHCHFPHIEKNVFEASEYQQLNQVLCLNEADNCNLLQQQDRNLQRVEIVLNEEKQNKIEVKKPLCANCSSKYESCEVENDSVVIPPREQRRMFTAPLMPVIAEDVHKSGDSDTDTVSSSGNFNAVQKSNAVQTANKKVPKAEVQIQKDCKKGIQNITYVDKSCHNMDKHSNNMPNKQNKSGITKLNVVKLSPVLTAPVSPGAQSNSSFNSQYSMNSDSSQNSLPRDFVQDKSGSLLDRLHKKYYPDQYNKSVKTQSGSQNHTFDSSQNETSGNLDAEKFEHVTLSPKSEEGPSKQLLLIPVGSGPKNMLSTKPKRSSPRQAVVGEGKPPPSPTSLKCKMEKSSEFHDVSQVNEIQNMKEENESVSQEIEAIEACKWLRAAGFPQYAQMYEDHQFPINIPSVEKDHDFLDKDSMQSLFRRLNTLNKSAGMKIEAPARKNPDESDEEEQCALSDKWKYQRSSRRWSRKDLDFSDLITPTVTETSTTASKSQNMKLPVKSSSSQDSLLTDYESTSHCEDSLLGSKKLLDSKHSVQIHVSGVASNQSQPVVNLFDNRDRTKTLKPSSSNLGNGLSREGSASPNLRRVQSEKVHGPKSFFKRIESFKTKKSSKKMRFPPGTKLEIGQPMVVNTEDMKERMERLGCKDISPKSLCSDMSEETQQLHEDLAKSFSGDINTSPSSLEGQTIVEDNPNCSVTGSDESFDKAATPVVNKEVSKEVKNNNSKNQFNLNNKTSELDRVVFNLENSEPLQTLSSFPKVITDGYIEMENGNRLNYRTGSFNLGSHSEDYLQNFHANMITNVRASSEDRDIPVSRRIQNINPEYRMSIYDNLGPGVDPQQELDNILHDLMENINGLNQSLGDSESLLELGTFGLKGYVPPSSTTTTNVDEPLTKQLKQKDVENCGSDPMDTSEFVSVRDKSSHIGVSHLGDQFINNLETTVESQQDKTQLIFSQEVHDFVKVPHNEGDLKSSENKTCRTSKDSDKHVCLSTSDKKIDSTVSIHQNSQSSQQYHSTVDFHQNDCVLSLDMDSSNIPSTSQSHDQHLQNNEVDSELEELPVDEEEEEEEEEDDQADLQSNSSGESTCSHHEDSDGEKQGSRDEGSDQQEGRERRDSGVGSSLTRAPSDRRRHRIRWHSFVKSHRPSLNSENLQLSHMSVGQLMVLRKLCLLKVTGLMEKYSPANRSGWNWAMPKFIKRFKAPDYKEKNVFGVPLLVILQRTGQPLPQCMLYAMRCLRRTAKDAVGIFRKSGVRSRIQKLRDDIEAKPESIDFETLQPYDVADLIKQYFRELPECLLTNKLSETFISIFTHVPCDERLEALQCTVMLLPDENREVLQSLLLFLSDMASHSHHNQMTASNLAVCFAPSLFHMFGQRSNPGGSPKRGRKNTGIPDQKELLEQKAAHECLTTMITECKKLFMVPEDLLSKCRFSYIEQGDPVPLEELGKKRSSEDSSSDHAAYIESCIQGLLKESREKFKGWVSVASPTNIDLAYKKVGDGHPLRLWKCAVDVEAPPEEVLNRVLRERHLWDVDLMKWRVVEKLDAQTEIFQYILNSMAPHPTRDFCELRSWRTQLPKGACVLVSTSVEHQDCSLLGCIRAVILASRYLIEPCGAGKSRLTHICRIDIRGHTPEWYNKAHGHICATFMARIRDSFKQTLSSANGPETKI